jgi:hypothetical protein
MLEASGMWHSHTTQSYLRLDLALDWTDVHMWEDSVKELIQCLKVVFDSCSLNTFFTPY